MKAQPWTIAAFCAALALAGCGGSGDDGSDGAGGDQPPVVERPFLPLEFPFLNPSDLVRLAAFGIPAWSGTEPHNGMDLIVNEDLASSAVISPTAGEVVSVSVHQNPYSHPAGQLLATVEIRVNGEWTVNLVLESGAAGDAAEAAQLAAVHVQPGQAVGVGTPIADLLVGPLGYAHLHYMVMHNDAPLCAYANSSDSARAILEALARRPNSNVPGGNLCGSAP